MIRAMIKEFVFLRDQKKLMSKVHFFAETKTNSQKLGPCGN